MSKIAAQLLYGPVLVFLCDSYTDQLNFIAPPQTEIIDPCNPSPCGSNAICNARNRAGSCQCIPEYFGDPYVACRPECVVHSDCPSNKACLRNKCVDPCPGTCGVNAVCTVKNHIPVCTCQDGYIGDPFTSCRLKPIRKCYVCMFECSLISMFQP